MPCRSLPGKKTCCSSDSGSGRSIDERYWSRNIAIGCFVAFSMSPSLIGSDRIKPEARYAFSVISTQYRAELSRPRL